MNKTAVQKWLISNDYDYVIPHIKQNGNIFTIPIIDSDNQCYGNTHWFVTDDKQIFESELQKQDKFEITTYHLYGCYFICF